MTDSRTKNAKQFDRLSFKCAGGKFKCGHVYVSSVCRDAVCGSDVDIRLLLKRHVRGDWEILPDSEKRKNEEYFSHSGTGGILKSLYQLPGGDKIAIMTSVKHMETAVFLTSENARLKDIFEGV